MAKKTKKTKVKVGIKEAEVVVAVEKKEPPGKPPKKIRMLVSCANPKGSYPEGSVYRVPQDVSVAYARGWIDCGAAEEVE